MMPACRRALAVAPTCSALLGVLCLVVPSGVAAQVDGVVVDAATGTPVRNARVGIQVTGPSMVTDRTGTFSLQDVPGSFVVVTAAAVGYYTASASVQLPSPGMRIALEAVPQDDNPDYVFKDPTTCSLCHIVQLEQWTNSPMAQAGRNSWTYDVYDGSGTAGGEGGFVYTRDSYLAEANPASECASCHQPERWIAEPHVALEDFDSLSRQSIHGVSCEVCHKIAHIDESHKSAPGIYPGVVTVTRPEPGSGQVLYGVLGDVDYHASSMRASYQPQLVAAVCCACHQDKNDPDNDGDFEEANGIISEPTYNEWLASPYADESSSHHATCVDCHMPAYGDSQACRVLTLKRSTDTIRSHRIEGTTARYLENAVSLSLAVDADQPDSLTVSVSIHNDAAGHHVPTGVSIRNVILLVEAWDLSSGRALPQVAGDRIHDLGGIGDPEKGNFAGLPGKLYAKITEGPDGTAPVFFTEAVRVVSDTRIPALATDETHFVFRRALSETFLQVRARLIYRRAWRDMVEAKGWTRTGHGEPLADIQAPHFGHLMEEAVWSSAGAFVRDFEAENTPEGVLLRWSVEASIRDLLGFRVWRGRPGSDVTQPIHDEDLLPFSQHQIVDADAAPGTRWEYHLRLVLAAGFDIEPPVVSIFTPSAVAVLEQNFPNPFNPGTTIAYVVPAGGAPVRLNVHDVRGRLVRTLVDGFESGGRRLVEWDGTDTQGVRVASGVYIATLRAGDATLSRRMQLLK